MSSQSLAVVPQYTDPQLLDTIKQTVCKNATDAQFRMFIEICKSTGLNPFLKEIYYVAEKGIIMASRDGYLRKANDHPQFDGMETKVERDDKGIPIKATCSVWRKDRAHPITCEAFYSEYKKGTPVWTQYPSAMIAKVAEALALKRSFAINGVVTEEEIGEQGSKEAQREYLRSKGIGVDPATDPLTPETQKALTDKARGDIRTASEAHKALIVETAKMLDEPPLIKTVEIRQSKKDAEAQAILDEAQRDQDAKAGRSGAHGCIPLDKLKNWKKLKDEIRSYTGTDEIYRSTLKAKGYEHANEIQTQKEATSIWTVLGNERNRLKQEKDLRETLEEAATVLGSKVFMDILGLDFGCASIDDVLQLESVRLEGLLKELKVQADKRKSKS